MQGLPACVEAVVACPVAHVTCDMLHTHTAEQLR